ncbi:MAG TPA: sulfate ABC transporter substrate-binding protein [Frankiaceae bacterium]|nr:sulfate ABC transporter substrate-binding protein [Frankiaceae bacterium]
MSVRTLPSRRAAALAGALLLAAVPVAACGSSSGSGSGGGGGKVQLSLVAYSTPKAAYADIIKAFQKTPQGKNITFTQSFGASGDQSRAVENGLKADVVAFSLSPDITRLVKDKIVAADWDKTPTKGMVTDSVVVIATRKGNPKGLKDWPDLIKPGVQVITPNPFTSGGARWNVMAAYGAQSDLGKNHDAGLNYLKGLFDNVPVQDDSARNSLQTFTNGKGDALISYENDALFAQQQKQPIDFTIPNKTILIENPVAVTANSAHPAEAKAFTDFLQTDTAQKIFADNGYRPVLQSAVPAGKFPTPAGLFTIDQLGGWSKVTTDFFDPTSGALVTVEQKNGVPTKK